MKNSLKQKQLEEQTPHSSKWVHKGRVISVRSDLYEFDPPHTWDVVLHPGAVAILPVNEKGHLYLIYQWRHPLSEILLEIPAGILEKGEKPLETAQRELQEEIGFRAQEMTPLGGIYTAAGFSNEYIHLFLGRKLVESSLPGDAHEAIDIVEMPLDEVLDLIDTHRITDAKTICAVLKYQRLYEK